MTEINPKGENIVDDVHRAVAERAAVKRAELWERMGFPQSKPHMAETEYEREYRGRIWFCNREVMEQGAQALKIIICPKCVEDQQFGVKGTRFYISVEDDVMTVFPAVGHFLCHYCGFEEWHPMKADIRVSQGMEAQSLQNQLDQLRHKYPPLLAGMAQGIAQVRGNSLEGNDYRNAIGKALTQGINPGMGPIWGMTPDEQQSLYRLYQQTQAKGVAKAPPIVQSKEEAEMLLKLAPVERRQAIIQKLRDLGKI